MIGSFIDYLKDKKDNILFPRTITEAVADKESGENLNQMLEGIVRTAGDEAEYIEDLDEHTGDVLARHDAEIQNLENYIGSLDNLTTEQKSNLVGAVNEIKAKNDSLQSEVTTHLADYAKSKIVEASFNANDGYIRYENGWQICFWNRNSNVACNQVEGSLYKSERLKWAFPASFLSKEYVTVIVSATNNGFGTVYVHTSTYADYDIYNTRNGWGCAPMLLAVGRWE